MFKAPVIGLVLAGGESRRMGTDKTRINYLDNRPQALFMYDLLSCYCLKTFLSIRKPSSHLINPEISDYFSFGGPLNGILTLITRFPGFSILTVPCDMPAIDNEVINRLLQEDEGDELVVCYGYENRQEPLPALWRPKALEPLLNQVERKDFSPGNFIQTHKARILPIPSVKQFININTPEESVAFKSGIHL